MYNLNKNAIDRLNHIDSNLNGCSFSVEFLGKIQELIKKNSGDFDSCVRRLQSYCKAKGVSNWYHGGDLSATKNLFYANAKLYYIRVNPPYHNGTIEPWAAHVFGSLEFLSSDHPGLINWYCMVDKDYPKFEDFHGNVTTSPDFYTQQFFYAFRGEWDILGERAERILANPPKSGTSKKFLPDHRFYLALARGNVSEMEQRITDLLTPRMLHQREGMEGGYTNQLLSTLGTVYAKLAWRHGYEVDLDTPYIPKEWLPVQPLESYEDPFEFMKQYDCPN